MTLTGKNKYVVFISHFYDWGWVGRISAEYKNGPWSSFPPVLIISFV